MTAARELPFVRMRSDGIDLFVRLTPKGARDQIEQGAGLEEARLRARVRAVPEKGAANRALEKLVAHWLDVPTRDVSVASGGKSRLKTVSVAGEPRLLAMKVARLLDSET